MHLDLNCLTYYIETFWSDKYGITYYIFKSRSVQSSSHTRYCFCFVEILIAIDTANKYETKIFSFGSGISFRLVSCYSQCLPRLPEFDAEIWIYDDIF